MCTISQALNQADYPKSIPTIPNACISYLSESSPITFTTQYGYITVFTLQPFLNSDTTFSMLQSSDTTPQAVEIPDWNLSKTGFVAGLQWQSDLTNLALQNNRQVPTFHVAQCKQWKSGTYSSCTG